MDANKDEQAKYDRQIRLWGIQGQRILMNSKICLLEANPAGVETLKNLILPGVGYFTIVDEKLVESKDLGNNFFVTENDIGRSRSEAVAQWLNELNPDVKGESMTADPIKIIENEPTFFEKFDLIITHDISDKHLKILGEICKKSHKSLILIRSSGLVGSVRIYNAIHTIVEGKAERDLDGYRLFTPFGGLSEFASSINFEKLDDFEHRHIPYFAILIQALASWKNTHDGQIPQNFNEKQEFSQFVKSKSRNFFEEENFQEAVKFSHKVLINPSNVKELPANVEKVFSSEYLQNVNSNSESFWIKASALKRFYQTNNALPVRSVIPDMTADTKSYLSLKKAFEHKAEEDRKEILSYIKDLTGLEDRISDEELKVFCDNVYNIDFIAYRTLNEELDSPLPLEIFETDCYKWHFGLRANAQFRSQYGRQPSVKSAEDLSKFKDLLASLQQKVEGIVADEDENIKISQEMLRYGGSQLHTIASFLGGVASQEAIKLLTHQFKPINHTYVYNGITSEAEVYEF